MLSNGLLPKKICDKIICEFHHPLTWSFPSIFRSAGQYFFILGLLLYSSAAQLETPESNQTSRTSGTLFRLFPDLDFIIILSIPGFFMSILLTPDNFLSSSREPTTIFSPDSESYHIGRGVPQYLCLETGQSEIPSSHAFILDFIHPGTHVVFSFSRRRLGFISEIFRNHCGSESIRSGDLSLRSE